MRRGQRLRQNILRRTVGIDHLDLTAMAHHFFYRPRRQIERTQQPVPRLFLHRPFRMAQRNRARDVFAQG